MAIYEGTLIIATLADHVHMYDVCRLTIALIPLSFSVGTRTSTGVRPRLSAIANSVRLHIHSKSYYLNTVQGNTNKQTAQ